ncbi:MAG: type II toxin-antitoxin system VapC family toxin [Chloroflexota bacterium]|nr:MAG: type II toxin-antitoxin system VapC family toxin [Chloroflexota bacterium]
MEIFQGTLREPDPQFAQAKLDAFLQAAPILPFSLPVARRCAQLRELLKRRGKRVRARALDLVVAETALENNCTLVTRNTDDYVDIPDLKLHRLGPPVI